jgi:hypothetical protein
MPRRRSSPEHDRTTFYERQLLEQRGLAVAKIEDPYGPDLRTAALELPKGRGPSDAVRVWQPPETRKLVVVRRIANDPLAALLHRRQLPKSSYEACRYYQQTFEMAAGRGQMQSPALEFTPRGGICNPPINDASLAAARLIRRWDGKIGLRFGVEGVLLLRRIIIHNQTLKQLAGENGVARTDGIGGQFRRIARELAILTGHSTAGRRTPHLFDHFVVVAIGIAARVAVQEAAE